MSRSDIAAIAHQMVADGRGILAADESSGTANKRLASVNVVQSEDNRRAYREMLFTTPGLGKHISGSILYDETIRQNASDGKTFVSVLEGQNILPGIKVDTGAKNLAGSPKEKITEGLDGLRERLAEYVDLGAKFTKWRAVITIGDGLPTNYCIDVNAHALARYAALAQEAGLVPIVEPEVLMDGTHTIETCRDVTEATLQRVFNALMDQRVSLEGMVLKPNMVISAMDCAQQAGVQQVAEWTAATLKRRVPGAVPGIAFLSGGQSEELATEHLNAMNNVGGLPWLLSFSYGRALQHSALHTWAGQAGNADASQKVLAHRAAMNSAATIGKYSTGMEKAA
jgi:fructose-bisphosphate aldolase class I